MTLRVYLRTGIAAIMLCAGVVACGSGEDPSEGDSQQGSAEVSEPAENVQPQAYRGCTVGCVQPGVSCKKPSGACGQCDSHLQCQ